RTLKGFLQSPASTIPRSEVKNRRAITLLLIYKHGIPVSNRSGFRLVTQLFGFRVELLFPLIVVVQPFLDEGREDSEVHQAPVDQPGRELQWLHEIDEKDHP